MSSISEILETIKSYSPDADVQPVMDAYLLAAQAHAGQTRKSGEPYLVHPLSVAYILADMRMDTDTIATALLHDALEDNPITPEEMSKVVGPLITELVDGVTKIGKLRFRNREELQAENFRKMMLAMSRDVRVILVKLADRTHNMRTLEGHKPEKRRTIAKETLDIFVPIANRLGLTRIKCELEDLCFRHLQPDAWVRIDAFLDNTQADREEYVERVVTALTEELATQGVVAHVSGRAKHHTSIHRKMLDQNMAVQDVADVLAFRAIVADLGQCYAALGLLHASFPPVPDRIKDYIARPKPNGYQSLHTTVVGPEGRRVEIQIRTEEMHRVAEDGIAAHWRYKEGKLALSPDDVLRISRIRELFESAREAENAEDFMAAVKVEFYADEVFIFTPQGDVKVFPAGATTLDFAYAIHTDVGHHCVGAKVNGRMVPLRYQLKSGDTVEILTSATQEPSRHWLDMCHTGRAISKIRRHLRQLESEAGVRLGREMLDGELKRFGWTLNRITKEGRVKAVVKAHSLTDLDALQVEVARGHLTLGHVIRDLLPDGVYQTRQEQAQAGTISSLFSRFRARTQSPVLISGEDGVLVNFAGCCGPLPGEPVVGFITRGRGITVHKSSCPQLANLDPDRRIPVEWDGASHARHSGEIEILCRDRPGMLANITKICEQGNVNIQRAEARPMVDERAVCTLTLAVHDVGELSRLIKNIEKLKGVESVARTMG